jgi:hypothetical protein
VVSARRGALVTALVLVVSCAWSLRVIGLFSLMRNRAIIERQDWAYIESDLAEGAVSAPTPAARALMNQLRDDALVRYPAPPTLMLPFSSVMVE